MWCKYFELGKFQPILLYSEKQTMLSLCLQKFWGRASEAIVLVLFLQSTAADISVEGIRSSWKPWSWKAAQNSTWLLDQSPVWLSGAVQGKWVLRCSDVSAWTGWGLAQTTQGAAAICTWQKLVCIYQEAIINDNSNQKQELVVQASIMATRHLSGCILHSCPPDTHFEYKWKEELDWS